MEKCGRGRPPTRDNITWRMRFVWWINMATDTHSAYVTLVFPRQQWSRERAPNETLYVHCLYFLLIGADFVTRHLERSVGT